MTGRLLPDVLLSHPDHNITLESYQLLLTDNTSLLLECQNVMQMYHLSPLVCLLEIDVVCMGDYTKFPDLLDEG
jgi:hypothetical protein